MSADLVPLIVGGLVFLSSILSLKLGLSVAIIEILLGAVGGYFGLKTGGMDDIFGWFWRYSPYISGRHRN